MNFKKAAIFLIGLLLLNLTGCAHSPSQKKVDFKTEKHNQIFESGYEALDRKSYIQASAKFEDLLQRPIGASLRAVTLYNLGVSYEEQKLCNKAVLTYKKLLAQDLKDFQRVQAEGLFRLSQSYECIGDYKRVITTLNDALKRGSFLSERQVEVEIPSRLAVAHAKMGNMRVAKNYFKKAEERAFELTNKFKKTNEKQETLSHSFYLMGKSNLKNINLKGSGKYIGSLRLQQNYLLKAVEINDKTWSAPAAEELMSSYSKVFALLKKIKTKQRSSVGRQKLLWKNQYNKLAKETYGSLGQAKRNKLEGAENLALPNKVYKKMQSMQQTLKKSIIR